MSHPAGRGQAGCERGEVAWARCEALLEASWNLRHEDPEGMIFLAAMAVNDAESIDPRTRGPAALADLQARAFAELGNARRVANDPLTAEADLLRARQRADLGTEDPLLLARLMDLTGSLRVAQRRFEEALQLLAWAFALYRDAGENHLAGKVLVTRALALGYEGDSPGAVSLLSAALPLLDAARDPRAAFSCIHSLIWFEAECGNFTSAWRLLWAARKLYPAYGGPRYALKLFWLEGRVAAGQQHTGRAERCFRKAREGFLAMQLPYASALVAMDLGILLLEQGRTAEARALIEETLETFNILRIGREAAGAVILLTQAAQQDQLTVAVLRQAAAEFQKAER